MFDEGGAGIKVPTNPQAFSTYDETGKLKNMADQLIELEYLGLVKQVSSYPSGLAFSSGGMITGWALTNFANDFISFIEEDELSEDSSEQSTEGISEEAQ